MQPLVNGSNHRQVHGADGSRHQNIGHRSAKYHIHVKHLVTHNGVSQGQREENQRQEDRLPREPEWRG